jgi:hypothetical protein
MVKRLNSWVAQADRGRDVGAVYHMGNMLACFFLSPAGLPIASLHSERSADIGGALG